MLLAIPDVLSAERLARVRALIGSGEWGDGNATSGHQSALAKRNRQLAEESPQAREAGGIVLDALAGCARFVAAALPLKVYPPLFSRYAPGDAFGVHVDNAVRIRRGSDFRIRSDLAATLFLADPADYDGGALVIEDRFGPQTARLPAGALLLYPASSLHRVEPVTRGLREAAFFWVQSMVRDAEDRRTLFELDEAIQEIASTLGQDDPSVVRLTGVYHNLLRRWAEL